MFRIFIVITILLQFACGTIAVCKGETTLNFPTNIDLGRLFYYWPSFQPGDYLASAKGRVEIRAPKLKESLALRLSPEGVEYPALSKVQALKKIRGIDLSIVVIDDVKLKNLAPVLCLFEDINLARTLITDASIPVLATNKKLHFLNLSTTKISGSNLALLKRTPITELRVGSVMLDKSAFEQIAQLSNLKMLDFTYTGFNWIKKALTLSDKDWDSQLSPYLQKLNTLIELESLSLNGVPAGPNSLKVLSCYPKLRILGLSSTSVDLAGIESVKSCPLKTLNIGRCPYIDDRCAKVLGQMKSLHWLELSYTKVTAEGLRNLSCPELTRLDLAGLKLSKSDLSFLGQLPSLLNVDVQNTGISDAAIPAISKHKGLTFLNLGNTRVTDSVVPLLSTLSQLRELDISGTDISETGFATLKSKLPKCKVMWD